MIKRNQQFFNVANMLLDMMLAAGSFMLTLRGLTLHAAALGAFVYGALIWLSLALGGFYNANRFYRLRQKALSISMAVLSAAILVLLLFNLAGSAPDMLSSVELPMLTFAVLVAKYTYMRVLMEALRARGYNIKHVVVVGTGEVALRYARDIEAEPRLGYRIWGFVGDEAPDLPSPRLCGYEGLEDLLHDTEADEAVIALEPGERDRLPECIMQCESNGVRYCRVALEEHYSPERYDTNVVGSTRLLVPRRGRLDYVGWAFCKRLFDVVLSAAGIVVLSPLLLLLAIGVKLSGPGPILFRQERVGYNRKTFTMLKFRSMAPNDVESTAWTSDNDSRRTGFGKFIRKYSLDELPQLFNVLAGSMSLVGPRPELPHLVEQYRRTIPGYMQKHYVRPGMTGLAQINGLRGDTSTEDRIACDLWYIRHWSFWLDLYIMWRTLCGGMVNSELLAPTGREVLRSTGRRTVVESMIASGGRALGRMTSSTSKTTGSGSKSTWQTALVVCAYLSTLLAFGYQVSRSCVSAETLAWWTAPCWVLLGCQIVVLVGLAPKRRPIELRLLFLSVVWAFVSRLLVRDDLILDATGTWRTSLTFFCLFATGACLGRNERRRIVVLFTIGWGVMLAIWSVVGLYLMATLKPVPGFESITLAAEGTFPPLTYLKFYRFHRNVTPVFYLCETALLLYQCLRGRHMAWKLATVAFLPLAYVMIAVQRSRTVYLVFAFLLVASYAAVRWRERWKSFTDTRRTVLASVAIAALALLFVGFTPIADRLLAEAHQGFVQERIDAYNEANQVEEAPGEQKLGAETAGLGGQQETEMPVSEDRRGTLTNLTTLSGRTAIWAALIPALRENPHILLVGQKDAEAMAVVNERIVWPFGEIEVNSTHMHNMLLQQLLVEGIVGLLICAGFLLSLLGRVVVCLRRRGRKVRPLCVLAVSLLAMMGYGMLEPLLSNHSIVDSMLFCFIAGYFVRELMEATRTRPSRKEPQPEE